MKNYLFRFICCLIALQVLLPTTCLAFSQSELTEIIQDENSLGNMGRFYIPSQDISIRIFSVKDHGDGDAAQNYVDYRDCGAYCISFDSGCGYIADHWNQGFINIKDCEVGCYAYIKTEDEIKIYKCVKNTTGYNKENYIITSEGETLKTIDWADICCFTCNGNWKYIYMVFFKEIQ